MWGDVCSRSIVSCFKNIAYSLGESAYICFTFDNALLPFLSQKLFALSARNYYRWRLNRVALPPAAHPRRIIKVSNITCVISLIVGAHTYISHARTQNERFSFMSRKTELNVSLSLSFPLSPFLFRAGFWLVFMREERKGLVALTHSMQLNCCIYRLCEDRRIKEIFLTTSRTLVGKMTRPKGRYIVGSLVTISEEKLPIECFDVTFAF